MQERTENSESQRELERSKRGFPREGERNVGSRSGRDSERYGGENYGRSYAGKNMGLLDRTFSSLVGAYLLAESARRRSGWSAAAAAGTGALLLYRGWTGRCSTYQRLGIDTSVGQRGGEEQEGRPVRKAVHINVSPNELYKIWRKLENLPRLMRHVRAVREIDSKRSHWQAEDPFGRSVEWEAEITEDTPGRAIGWHSLPGAEVASAGRVEFREKPDGGTNLQVELQYTPPGGKIGASLLHLIGRGLEEELDEDLRRFKQLIEAGEVPRSEPQPAGNGR